MGVPTHEYFALSELEIILVGSVL